MKSEHNYISRRKLFVEKSSRNLKIKILSNGKIQKDLKIFLYTFQNFAHLLESKTQFGHFWKGEGIGAACRSIGNTPIKF